MLEAVYRTPDVVAQRHATLHALGLQAGERALDVGAGPGFLVAEMAEQVGPNGHVTGLDISDSMVALAQRRCAKEPIKSRTTIVKGDATALPFPDASFDVAVSAQVYEYVPDITGHSPSCTGCCGLIGGCRSSIPTGTWWSGMPTAGRHAADLVGLERALRRPIPAAHAHP